MQEKQSNLHQPVNSTVETFKPGPVSLFVASVAIIFVAEAFVMLIIHFLKLPENFFIGIVDAALLSLIVIPTLYFMFFKPMRETILKLDTSEKAQKQLEEIDQLKNDFISIASHELCTPVSVITGYAEILLDEVESEQQKEYLEVILKKTETLGRIIDDLGVVNRLESGESLQIKKAENDLLKTVKDVCKVYQLRFPDKQIHLESPETPLNLLFDEVRIRQVLDNLLSNAVKYSNDIHDAIDLSVVDQEEHVLIRIADQGIGMSKDELKLIYDKFFRAKNERPFVGGLGLGMAIVKNIIESHNGTIDIISQRNVGMTVTVALPK